jgi:hypothetical protein
MPVSIARVTFKELVWRDEELASNRRKMRAVVPRRTIYTMSDGLKDEWKVELR